jgi:hypothetical protein
MSIGEQIPGRGFGCGADGTLCRSFGEWHSGSGGLHLHRRCGWFKFLTMVCSAAQWAKNVVHCKRSAGSRRVLSYGQRHLSGGVERPENPNPT